MKEIKIGLIGFGTVGAGVVKILGENAPLIAQRLGGEVRLHKIADIDLKRDRGVQVAKEILTTDAEVVLTDPEISICIELVGGIEPARTFILKAIENGKHVVTANKALLALHGAELFASAQNKGVRIGFEASVGGGIPIIRSLREGLVANRIIAIFGILNGTSNYILTRMTQEGKGFGEILKDAQRLGLNEGDKIQVKAHGPASITFNDVVVRIKDGLILQMHVDTDEANAAGFDPHNWFGEMII